VPRKDDISDQLKIKERRGFPLSSKGNLLIQKCYENNFVTFVTF